MRKALLLLSLLQLFGSIASAELILNPRYDYIQSKDEELANRFMLSASYSYLSGPLKFFVEGFGDFELNEDQRFLRRSPHQGYLQEAYLELSGGGFFFKVGKQAMRWSESWLIPSLDIWSGRKFNRLYFDPFKDQLNHSTGMSLSYAGSNFSADLFLVGEYAETNLPFPLPDKLNEGDETVSYGARIKSQLGAVDYSVIAAKVPDSETYGAGANYAFDNWVPKLEVGMRVADGESTGEFASLGADIFWGDWVLIGQGTLFQDKTRVQSKEQLLTYFSGQWRPEKHELTLQAYFNTTLQDSFLSVSYGYEVFSLMTLSAFVQTYSGKEGLYAIYEELTQETVLGIRADLTKLFEF